MQGGADVDAPSNYKEPWKCVVIEHMNKNVYLQQLSLRLLLNQSPACFEYENSFAFGFV